MSRNQTSMKVAFDWNGLGYSVQFDLLQDNLYEGDIVTDRIVKGKALLHLFSFNDKGLGRIEWREYGYDADCFLYFEPHN